MGESMSHAHTLVIVLDVLFRLQLSGLLFVLLKVDS